MIIRIVAYLIILAILFFFNTINTSYIPFLLDALFVLITVSGLVTVFIHHRCVKVMFESDNITAERTHNQLIRCKIINKSILPVTRCKVRFVARHRGSKKSKKYIQNIFCAGRGEEFMEFFLDCPDCEIINIKITGIYLYDFTGLFCLRKRAGQTNMVVVMPKLPPIEIIDKMAYVINEDDGTIYSETKPGDDPTEIFAIRDYVPGDNIRKIHWKLSSKSDKLMVKDYSFPIKDNDTVIIDLFLPDKKQKSNNNQLFDLFYGLVNAMTSRKVGFNACYYDGEFKIKRIETQNDIVILFSQLYNVEAYPSNVNGAAKLFYAENNNRTRMFYVTNFLDDNTEECMKMLSELGVVFYLIPGYVHNSYMPVRYVW